ncbi:MAG: Na+:solute symporter [Thermoguttaceae bacterium]|nr:Na+:solute symporter [Thermoguttaceae bacterium]
MTFLNSLLLGTIENAGEAIGGKANLNWLDIAVLVLFFLSTLWIGLRTMRKAGQSSSEFFLSGRSIPWWLLGFSLVATTFSADTPNLVTDIVRKNGVAGNWAWWAFLPTGLTTVFIYAKLWRKSGVTTDIEFYEMRYSGKSGAFVRGFRTLYLGLIVNTFIMASVTLAIIKIFGVILGLSPLWTTLIAGSVTVIFTAVGGFSAVLWADFVLFIVAMVGSVAAAIVAVKLPEVGGLTGLFTNPLVESKLSFFPDFNNLNAVLTLLAIPLVVQWWSAWYPGAEPGGGSYTAQRMLAAKTPTHAVGATFFFNVCHYAVRPWPWILVALASIVVFPNLDALKEAFPSLPEGVKMDDDLAYPAMMTMLPHGILGIVVASLFAAYMSTIATHLNLGSSYMVNDFYKRFVNPNAPEKKLVLIGRVWTIGLMIAACLLALTLRNALQAFEILLLIGAGTGLLFLLRWFWWRINAYSEIAAMCFAFPTAIYFQLWHASVCCKCFGMTEEAFKNSWLSNSGYQLVISVALTTIGWLLVTYLTPPDSKETLYAFVRKTRAGGPGWKKVYEQAKKDGVSLEGANDKWPVPMGILCSFVGCIAIYCSLFTVGSLLYGSYTNACALLVVTVVSAWILFASWKKMERITVNNGTDVLTEDAQEQK